MSGAILNQIELGFPWQTADPFLFCVHHLDHYPKGNPEMGPDASLRGRNLGQDFAGKDGWSMYHGERIPGFPAHPHRGFETITIARQGYIDHADSLGATARFGPGDVQWMTAGKGVVHSEMFPLRSQDHPNTGELFQIWLNLPRSHKMVDPHFTMLWSEDIPVLEHQNEDGARARVRVIAGSLEQLQAPAPPPKSWASNPDAHLTIYTITLEPGATWTLPSGHPGLNRALYFFSGQRLEIESQRLERTCGLSLASDQPVGLRNGGDDLVELLLLQGLPIQEPVAQHGPFVMNEPHEIRQAMADFGRTRFGTWPWETSAPVHAREQGRFAIHADGRREER